MSNLYVINNDKAIPFINNDVISHLILEAQLGNPKVQLLAARKLVFVFTDMHFFANQAPAPSGLTLHHRLYGTEADRQMLRT